MNIFLVNSLKKFNGEDKIQPFESWIGQFNVKFCVSREINEALYLELCGSLTT